MNILFATDGSEGARTAGRLLAALRLPEEARVTVLTASSNGARVLPPVTRDPSATDTRLGRQCKDEGEMAQRPAEIAAAALREYGISADVRVRHQGPVSAILDQAREEKAELIFARPPHLGERLGPSSHPRAVLGVGGADRGIT